MPSKLLRPAVGLLAALVAVGAAGCGAAAPPSSAPPAPIRVVDDAGQHLTLKAPVHRLVVIAPSNFEIVDALGLRSDIVGVDTSVPSYTPPPWTAAAHGLPSIGNALPEPSAEAVVARRPQLVITNEPLSDLKSLTSRHIPVMVLDPTSVAGVYRDIQLVGAVTGHSRRASRLIASLRRGLATLSKQLAHIRRHPTVFYDLGGLYTTGPNTFLTQFIQLAGGRNALAPYLKEPWPQVTAEQVVRANPDYILIDSSAGTTVAQELRIAGFSATTAAKDHHVLVLPNSSYLDQPSIGLVQGVRELAHILHPRWVS
jgi:iron complex transport system substrate-binding protein